MGTFLRRLRARIKYWNHDRDLAREIEAHREMAARRLAGGGVSDRDARAAASRLLGNTTLAREDARRVWLAAWIESVGQDLRYAVRALRRSPAFTLAAGGALVVAVGLNAGLFAVFNAIALKPWPISDPASAIIVFLTRDGRAGGVSPVEYRYLRDRSVTTKLAAIQAQEVVFGDDASDNAEPARFVTGNYFDVLSVKVRTGRPLVAGDDVIGAPRAVVVLGDAVWRRRLGADPGVVGRPIVINGVPFTVVGIAEPGATDSALDSLPPSAFLPLAALPLANGGDEFSRELLTSPNHCCVRVAGRLVDGRTSRDAQAELSVAHLDFRRTVAHASPEALARMGVSVTDTRLISQQESERLLPMFELMFAGMALLLLLACANVGNLQLARALSRRREVAIRLALGASRGRLVRQLLTEGAVLAAGAGAVALVIARVAPPFILVQLTGGEDAAALDLSPDVTLVAFSLGLSIAASVLFGLAPALRVTQSLAGGARTNRETNGGRVPLRTALLAAQVAISTVLLIGAGLLIRGVVRASTFDLGFRTTDVIVAGVELPRNAYSADARQAWYSAWRQTLEQAGLGEVGTGPVPLSGRGTVTAARLPGESEQANRFVQFNSVSPGYFAVLGLRVAAGRALETRDAGSGVVVNGSLARLLWSTTDVVGRPFYAGRGIRTVVGVAEDAHLSTLGQVPPAFFDVETDGARRILVRDAAGVRGRVAALTTALEARAILTMHPLSENVSASLRDSRIGAGLAVGVGIAGLVLAVMGAFGVFAYLVNERAREIGIRRAIGARRSDVAVLVLGRTARALGSGLGIGLTAALLAGPVLRTSLYGLSPRDPVAFLLAMGVLAVAAVVATIIPLRRAMRIDPAITLRQD